MFFSVATIFVSCRLPCAAADSGRLASIFNLTGRLAPQYSRYSHLDQAPSESCCIFKKNSRSRRFLAFVSLVAPVAAADDASCLAWISHLAGRQAPRRPSSADRHQAPCKSRDISRFLGGEDFSQQRRFLASFVAPVAAADTSCLVWISDLAGRHAPRRPRSVGRHQAPCKLRGLSRFPQRRRFLALSPPLSPPQGVKSPRAPLDARSSDFGISCVYGGLLKAEVRGFPTSHLRASSDAVECNRGQRQVGPQPRLPLHDRPNFL